MSKTHIEKLLALRPGTLATAERTDALQGQHGRTERASCRADIERQLGLRAGALLGEADRSDALQATLNSPASPHGDIERQLGLPPGSLGRSAALTALAMDPLRPASTAALPDGCNGTAQLLPCGAFNGRDGRPGHGRTWKIDDAQGQRVAHDMSALAAATPIVIDYDHQTLHVQATGRQAPAAGWVLAANWKPGVGLVAAVKWTALAAERIANREYRFASPVIQTDAADRVIGVSLAALCNFPSIVGMAPVQSWSQAGALSH